MKIRIEQTLFAGTAADVELPFDWSEVTDWFIKWDSLFYKTKNSSEWGEISLNSESLDVVDWKRPMNAEIYELDEDGDALCDEPIATI